MYTEDSTYEGSSGFVAGMLAGVTVGLGLGMLFAPRTGAEMRRTIAGSASDLKEAASETYKQTSGRVRDMVDRGRDQARDLVDRGRDQARDAVRTAQDAMNEATYNERSNYGTPGGSSVSSTPSF